MRQFTLAIMGYVKSAEDGFPLAFRATTSSLNLRAVLTRKGTWKCFAWDVTIRSITEKMVDN